jgi:hypothetical protein
MWEPRRPVTGIALPPYLLRVSLLSLSPVGTSSQNSRCGKLTHFAPRAEVKNCGVIPPLPHTSSCRGAYLIKYRDSFTLHFISLFSRVVGFTVSWDVISCGLVQVCLRFVGMYGLRLQGWKVYQAICSVCCLMFGIFAILSYPEHGRRTLLRIVRKLLPDYTESQTL